MIKLLVNNHKVISYKLKDDKLKMSKISEKTNEEKDNDLIYQLDPDGYLMNENNQHILDK